jgi:hypothetical protein
MLCYKRTNMIKLSLNRSFSVTDMKSLILVESCMLFLVFGIKTSTLRETFGLSIEIKLNLINAQKGYCISIFLNLP